MVWISKIWVWVTCYAQWGQVPGYPTQEPDQGTQKPGTSNLSSLTQMLYLFLFRNFVYTLKLWLHLFADHFYEARKNVIENRLSFLERLSREEMVTKVVSSWQENYGTKCSIINWDTFKSVDMLKQIVSCFEPRSLANVMGRLIRDHKVVFMWKDVRKGV